MYINLKLNRKKSCRISQSENNDSHLAMQKRANFNFKISVISNGLEIYVSFTTNDKLSFIEIFQFLGSSLDSFNNNLCKDDLKYLSQEFDNNVLDLVKKKRISPYEYMSGFEKFKEELLSKESFCSSLTKRKINDKKYKHVLNIWNKSEMKTIKDYHGLNLRCDILLLADMFKTFRNNNLKNYGLCKSHYLSTKFKLGCNA